MNHPLSISNLNSIAMKTKLSILQTIIITIICGIITIFITHKITTINDKKLVADRVYQYFGEGDMGTEVLYAIETGDTTEYNYQPRDYQLEITQDTTYIYDGNRLVNKLLFNEHNEIDSVFLIDNE